MRLGLLVAVVASCVSSALAGGSAQPIESGRIVVGRGVHGVSLGMTRAQVVARLGRPISQNAIGYMEYSEKHLFDVYVRRGTPKRTDLISAAGPGFCLSGGICSLTKGSLKRLVGRFGERLERRALSGGRRRSGLRHPQPLPRAAGQHGLLARTWTDRPGLHRLRRSRRAGVRRATALGARPGAAGRSGCPGRSPIRVLRPHRRHGHVRRSIVPRAAGRASMPAARKRRRERLRHVSALPLRGRRRRMVGGGLLAAALGRRWFRRVVPEGEWGLARLPPADRPPALGGSLPLFLLSPLRLRVRVAHDRLPGFVVLAAVAALVPLPALVVHAAYPLVDAEPAPEPLTEGRGAPAHFRSSFT